MDAVSHKHVGLTYWSSDGVMALGVPDLAGTSQDNLCNDVNLLEI